MKKSRSLLVSFIWAFIIIIVIPTFIINTTLNSHLKEMAAREHSSIMIKNMEYISKSIEGELRRLRLKTAMIISDEEVTELLKKWQSETERVLKWEWADELNGLISRRFDYLGEIDSAYFFLDNEGYYGYNGLWNINEDSIRNQSWYQDIKNRYIIRSLDSLGGQLKQKRDPNQFTIVSGMNYGVGHYAEDNIEAVIINYKTEIFKGLYSDFTNVFHGELTIFDEVGNVKFSSNPDLRLLSLGQFPHLKEKVLTTEAEYGGYYEPERKQIVTFYKTPKSHWIIMNRSRFDVITRSISELISLFNIGFGIALVLFVLFSVFYFGRVVTALKKLITQMKRAQKGNFSPTEKMFGFGEIRELENAFHIMVTEIARLIDERDEKEREKREEEIKALQAQISPHFIYNTLNCIRIMSMISHQKNITELTDAFMELLSGMFKDPDMTITLEKELEYLKHYIYIMKVRFGDTFQVRWDVEEDVKHSGVLKLLLQPLVENAITHGITQIEGEGLIIIKAYRKGESLILEVRDNGPGISEERKKSLLKGVQLRHKGLNHVGVHNVSRRIQLNYGESHGLDILTEKGKYTCIRLRIPLFYPS